jgi:hypothetical protein
MPRPEPRLRDELDAEAREEELKILRRSFHPEIVILLVLVALLFAGLGWLR